MTTLAYIPFVNPIDAVQHWWYLLLVPLAFGISVIYKAMRTHSFDRFWRQTMVMTVQIVLGMVALAVVVTLLVQLVIPAMPVE